jgi:sugar phosphate isomerase/epimerase
MLMNALEIGVCSWSLQVTCVNELAGLMTNLGLSAVQIACGDPHHAAWSEGDSMPAAALASGLNLTGAMLGFPGEDYTTPASIKDTGGFGNPATRVERLERLSWALDRTIALELNDLMLHAGFIPEIGDSARPAFLDTLGRAASMAALKGIILAFETGQETAILLRKTLDELKCPNVKVNFDPANMLLYDKGDPLQAIDILGPDIRSVHVKDAIAPTVEGQWGEELPLGKGRVNIPAFISALKRVGYKGPLCIEREVGDQASRINDIRSGIKLLQECLG